MRGKAPQRGIIICDEAHNLENELIKNGTLSLFKDSFKYLNLESISYPSDNLYATDSSKIKWLFEDFFPKIKKEVAYLQEQLFKNTAFKATKEFKRLTVRYSVLSNYYSACKNLEIQNTSKNGKIIISSSEKGIEFRPLYGNNLFMKSLNEHSDKFLFMSATILNKKTFCKDLGIPEHECEYISLDSVFPVENRPIYYKPVGSLAWKDKAKTLPILAAEVDKLLFKYSNVKGIIHTVNYDIAEYIIRSLKNSPNCERLLMPKGDNRTEILKMFYRSTKPLVLISPSLAEGIDLKEDLSRFCIICKVPYSNLANKWVKTRMDENPEWYAINTAETLLQQTGRSIRSESDKADTYILDSAFLQFAKTNGYLLPQWWKDSVIIES